ncbi:MAG TPA: alanyl-tRNA editing protein, partial [Deinococcales bacterium]|nr:alanyl-tRNA editing protein [Deinococcales bacterium]
MPTRRLYRQDSYARDFQAVVTASERGAGPTRVVLDETLFYPTAGGQQHDEGTLAGCRVVDVLNEGDEVVHVLDGAPALEPGTQVSGSLDWARRLDFMQQHTGEHILGQAFLRLGYGVIAVAMGESTCTLDLGAAVSDEEASRAEEMANEAVWAGHPVSAYELPEPEALALPLRRPPAVSGSIRVVQIGDFDYSACGGTHLRNSAEVGMVKVLGTERVKGGATRVYFHCGRRALADYRLKHAIVAGLARDFSTSEDKVPDRIAAALEDGGAARRDLADTRARLAAEIAARLAAGATGTGVAVHE